MPRFTSMELIAFATEDDDDEELILMSSDHYGPELTYRNLPRTYILRQRYTAERALHTAYFSDNPTYSPEHFRRRFRMRKELFSSILSDIENTNVYFIQSRDAAGRLGFSARHKITVALRQLAYGTPADSLDEFFQIGETTALKSLKEFCKSISDVYSSKYLRKPTQSDVKRLFQVGDERGFPGMLGSIDCMHWEWKNCPMAWHGQYTGKEKRPTLILEAVASYNLWIWHFHFGLPGSLNNISVLDRSPIFDDFCEGKEVDSSFEIQGKKFPRGYYLADGIYPQWSTLIQSISSPMTEQRKYFAKRQESVRKDIERAFGVLQGRWAYIRGAARILDDENLKLIMKACVILHNMIVEDNEATGYVESAFGTGDTSNIGEEGQADQTGLPQTPASAQHRREFLDQYQYLRDKHTHQNLCQAIIENLWSRKGDSFGYENEME